MFAVVISFRVRFPVFTLDLCLILLSKNLKHYNVLLSTKSSFQGNAVLVGADLQNNTHCYSTYLLLFKEALLTSFAGFARLKKGRNVGIGLFIGLKQKLPGAFWDMQKSFCYLLSYGQFLKWILFYFLKEKKTKKLFLTLHSDQYLKVPQISSYKSYKPVEYLHFFVSPSSP